MRSKKAIIILGFGLLIAVAAAGYGYARTGLNSGGKRAGSYRPQLEVCANRPFYTGKLIPARVAADAKVTAGGRTLDLSLAVEQSGEQYVYQTVIGGGMDGPDAAVPFIGYKDSGIPIPYRPEKVAGLLTAGAHVMVCTPTGSLNRLNPQDPQKTEHKWWEWQYDIVLENLAEVLKLVNGLETGGELPKPNRLKLLVTEIILLNQP